MKRLSENYPKAVHGESLTVSKYAALSALWAMELLVPWLHPFARNEETVRCY